jgi:hypothetical protein
MRTPEEIIAHIEKTQKDDLFGFETGDLVVRLSFADAKRFLKPEAKEEDWKQHPTDDESIKNEIKAYLPFAYEKATGHRGLSAGRSLSHMRAWAWLLGDQDKFNWDNYENYGCPVLKQIAEYYGAPLPDGSEGERFLNMARGQKCRPKCQDGCGT